MTERLFAQSAIHQAVFTEAAKELVAHGQFRKIEVMNAVGDVAMIDAIRWDWIVKKLIATHQMAGGGRLKLIPVAEAFFKASAKKKAAMHTDYKYKHEDSYPGKYVAQGHGKRTTGWVLGTFADGRFALYTAGLMKRNAKGKQDHLTDFGEAVAGSLGNHPGSKAKEIAQVAGINLPAPSKTQ